MCKINRSFAPTRSHAVLFIRGGNNSLSPLVLVEQTILSPKSTYLYLLAVKKGESQTNEVENRKGSSTCVWLLALFTG